MICSPFLYIAPLWCFCLVLTFWPRAPTELYSSSDSFSDWFSHTHPLALWLPLAPPRILFVYTVFWAQGSTSDQQQAADTIAVTDTSRRLSWIEQGLFYKASERRWWWWRQGSMARNEAEREITYCHLQCGGQTQCGGVAQAHRKKTFLQSLNRTL